MVTMKLVGIPLLGLIIGASAAVVILCERVRGGRVRRQMSGRVPLSDEEFGANFFPAVWTEVASKVRQIIGDAIDIDMSRADPSDRFVQDLRVDALDSLASIVIVMKVEEEFGITITDDETRSIITIEQLVHLVASKLASKQRLPSGKPSLLWDRELDT
jgi:acyl carrier protein